MLVHDVGHLSPMELRLVSGSHFKLSEPCGPGTTGWTTDVKTATILAESNLDY
jgi:hypothetical protein